MYWRFKARAQQILRRLKREPTLLRWNARGRAIEAEQALGGHECQRWKSALEEVERWKATQRLADAINRLKEMAALSHPRLVSFACWAKEQRPGVEAAYQAACQERARLLDRAEAAEQPRERGWG
jgi:hypothetical protein